jgi:ABC-2 type transport system permease protein
MNAVAEPVSDALPEPRAEAPALAHATRPFFWSVRRELWENRSIYVAPLAAAGVVLLGFLVSARRIIPAVRAFVLQDPSRRAEVLLAPYGIAAMVILFTTLVVAVFYCLGALHNERRDRSILFWKSLPVSDLVTVLAKAFIPLAVLPVIAFVVIFVTQVVMVLVVSAVLAASGMPPSSFGDQFTVFRETPVLIYGIVGLTLWHAPVYAWLLLVSGWARRAPFLWAFGAPIAVTVFEFIAFGTSVVGNFFWNRLVGGFDEVFMLHGRGHSFDLSQIDAGRFFANPGLWLGLVVAAALIGACVWLRRWRDPV